jgi:predicted  nucleic acid-binding Zn-ribbon protein
MTQTEIIWKYQEAEMELDKLQKELEQTPERQKLRKLRRILQEQSDKIEAHKNGIKEKEAELENGLNKLEALLKEYDLEQDDLNIMMEDEECTAEELTESRKSMESLLEKVNSLRKSLSETKDWIEKTSEAIKETYAKGAKTKRDYEAAKAVVETEKLERKPVIDKAQKEVERIELQLAPDILKRYKAIKKKYPNPVATITDNRCSGCGMSVSMSVVKKFQAGNQIIECENCGRIIC